jgi:alkaline phosphatase
MFLPKYSSFSAMNNRRFLLSLLFLLAASATFAQSKFTHSHNDYNNNTPFYRAFYDGFNAIEADIFCVNNKLLIAHDKKNAYALRTLKGLYLDPINYALQKDTTRQLCLLIDIKDDYKKTLSVLMKELSPLKKYLMTTTHPGRLKILISGNRPTPAEFKNYPLYLFFDNDLTLPHTKAQWNRIGQVSLNFEKYSKWKGIEPIPEADRLRITHTIDSVHTNTGKLVRFWGAPDVPLSWDTQINCGADIIGTDLMEQLINYLAGRQLLQPVTAVIK